MSHVSRTASTSSLRCVATLHVTTIDFTNHLLPICLQSFGAFLYIYTYLFITIISAIFIHSRGVIFACGKQTQKAFNFGKII